MYVIYNAKLNLIGGKGPTESDAWLDHHDKVGSPEGYQTAAMWETPGCSKKHVFVFEDGISYFI